MLATTMIYDGKQREHLARKFKLTLYSVAMFFTKFITSKAA